MMKSRFTNVNHEIWQYGEVWCIAGGEHCADVIATALNEICDENEMLKIRFNEERERALNFCRDIDTLTVENEQLKIKLEDIALDMENANESNNDAQYELYKIKKENEKLKKGMIEVVDKYIRNVEYNPPSSARTYLKVKGALVNVREGLRDLLEDLE